MKSIQRKCQKFQFTLQFSAEKSNVITIYDIQQYKLNEAVSFYLITPVHEVGYARKYDMFHMPARCSHSKQRHYKIKDK